MIIIFANRYWIINSSGTPHSKGPQFRLSVNHNKADTSFTTYSMPSSRQAVQAPNAPKANANYSHAVRSSNGTVYLAGWMGDDPVTGEIVKGGIEAQTVGQFTD